MELTAAGWIGAFPWNLSVPVTVNWNVGLSGDANP